MYILGLSFDYHDSAAAIISDNKIIAAAEEERFTRIKHDNSFPKSAIQFCLEQANISASELDSVVYYEDTLLKFDRILNISEQYGEKGKSYVQDTVENWIDKDKFEPLQKIAEFLNIPVSKISSIKHHQSHAASSFYCSPYEQAVVITIDGVGEYETLTVSSGKANDIKPLYNIELPHSLGLFYSAFTAFLGFEVNEGEYKVMGMAGFGNPIYKDKISPLVELKDDGTFKLDLSYFDLLCPEKLPYTEKMIDLLGHAREPETHFITNMEDYNNNKAEEKPNSTDQRFADIAASVQSVTEEILLHIVKHAMEYIGLDNVCLSGGVALNSLANGRIQRELNANLYVQPAAGDSGGALGAALFVAHQHYHLPRYAPLSHIYLGKEYSQQSILDALLSYNVENYTIFENEEDLLENVAEKLFSGQVVGWFQGRFEWGPRSLGSRSILASPALPDIQDMVNQKIKFREPFRPFAPSVLTDNVEDFFILNTKLQDISPEEFMLSIAQVKPDKQALIPAVTHVDGTARLQLVKESSNSKYYLLIKKFLQKSGIPLLLNTSFNRRGEPIVTSPSDALNTFFWSELDCLVMENILITKMPL